MKLKHLSPDVAARIERATRKLAESSSRFSKSVRVSRGFGVWWPYLTRFAELDLARAKREFEQAVLEGKNELKTKGEQ